MQKLKNMRKTTLIITLLISTITVGFGQFHTMKIPQASNHVKERQTLAITDISIDYSSPSVGSRDVWNNPNIIPQNGTPIAWRAGANMNTVITFSTDVFINGQPLSKGSYGFHIIPKGDTYTLLFAHNNDQWGSYYLEVDNDVTLKVDVKSEECSFSEKLDYEFLNWKENSVTIGLEWAERRIPFEVSVDLNKTVLESFRSELRGVNTYRWEAWNDAARWCLSHNTNLEEALEWVNRSINGGYNGFAANKNLTNLNTKIQILQALNRTEEIKAVLPEALAMAQTPDEVNGLSFMLVRLGQYDRANEFLQSKIEEFPDAWFLKLNQSVALYFLNKHKRAIQLLEEVISVAPENYLPRLNEIKEQFVNKNYKFPTN